MGADTLILKPKKWAKLLYIFGVCPAIIAAPGYILYSLFSSGAIYNLVFLAQVWLVVTLSVCILVGIYGIMAFNKAEITLDDRQIDAKQFLHKTVPYESIESVTVYKNGITVSDGSFKNRVSLDFMYEGVDQAIRLLTQKISNHDGITFKGDKELIEKHFGNQG